MVGWSWPYQKTQWLRQMVYLGLEWWTLISNMSISAVNDSTTAIGDRFADTCWIRAPFCGEKTTWLPMWAPWSGPGSHLLCWFWASVTEVALSVGTLEQFSSNTSPTTYPPVIQALPCEQCPTSLSGGFVFLATTLPYAFGSLWVFGSHRLWCCFCQFSVGWHRIVQSILFVLQWKKTPCCWLLWMFASSFLYYATYSSFLKHV